MPGRKIKIGTAGWSYKDWEVVVYPKPMGVKFDPLAFLANFFDTIEINSSFYRPPTPQTARSWARRVTENPNFTFTAKLHQVFTHKRGQATKEDEKEFREGIDPLAQAGKLGAILIQFPWSFKNESKQREYLFNLLGRFKDYPLVIEVRHASWNQPAIYESLEEMGVGICNIDQPLFARSIKPSALTTSSIGYVRLHGRNYQNWFREKAPRDDRYNYLYTPEELDPWIARIKEVAAQTKETYVITNNHFRGKAVVNALELKSTLEEKPVRAPAPLLETYPELADSVAAEHSPQESNGPRLF